MSNPYVLVAVTAIASPCILVLIRVGKSYLYPENLPPMVEDSIGYTLAQMSSSRSPFFMEEMLHKYGHIYRLFMPIWDPWYVICDPKLARIILEGDKSKEVAGADKALHIYQRHAATTDNILSMFIKSTFDKSYEIVRKGTAPSFSKNNIIKRKSHLHYVASEFCHIVGQHADNNIILNNVETWCLKLTMDFITSSMFGKNFNSLNGHIEDDIALFINEIDFVLKEVALKQFMNPLRQYMFWLPDVIRQKQLSKCFMNMAKRLMNEYREKIAKREIERDSAPLLDRLIRVPYSSEDSRAADFIMYLVAGHDTTAYQLAHVISQIAKHPDVMKKLQIELDDMISAPNEPIEPDVIEKLTYMDCAIKEAMRLVPVAGLGSLRQNGCGIHYNGLYIPKGVTVAIPFYAMFRNASIREPTSYLPERWLPGDKEEAVLQELFIPFSSGKRNCIAQNLAVWELQLFVATLFRNFNFELANDIDYEYFLTFKPSNLNLKVSRRY